LVSADRTHYINKKDGSQSVTHSYIWQLHLVIICISSSTPVCVHISVLVFVGCASLVVIFDTLQT